MERTVFYTRDSIICTKGCMKVLDQIDASPDGNIDTPSGRVQVLAKDAFIRQNGKDYCLQILIKRGGKGPNVALAHNLA